MGKTKDKRKRHREKGRCSCGMKKRDYRVLKEHAKARGHRVTKIPKAGGPKYDTVSKVEPFKEWGT